MDRLGDALEAFLRSNLKPDDWLSYAVFISASGIIALAIVLLDLCCVAVGRNSYLDLTHGLRATPRAALFWAIGTMIASGLGLVLHIFQLTPSAAVLASLTWGTLLGRLQRLLEHHKPGAE